MRVEDVLKTNEAKKNFLKGLVRVSKADNVIDEKETQFFRQAALNLGLSETDATELDALWKSTGKINIDFNSDEEKMFFFIQAIQLAWIDDAYVDQEKEEIQLIADELKISKDAISNVEAWVEEGMKWNRRGDELLKLK